MEETLDAMRTRLESLSRVVEELERRVSTLEGSAAPVANEVVSEQPEPVPATVAEGPAMAPLFGWALLGVAGAYLLRSFTESGAIPGSLAAIAGIIYAGWWMFLAERKAWDKPLVAVVYGLTASLILVPMLWEMTVRFHLLPLTFASTAAVVFAVLGLAIGWKHNITAIAWIATLAALVTAFGLFRETHDAAALTITVLVLAAAVEASAVRDHWLSLRWVVAMAADLLVVMLTVFATRPTESGVVPEIAWQVVFGTQVALLAIYLSSTVSRTILRGLIITGFEVGQVAAAAAVSIGCALRLAEQAPAMTNGVGLFCLAGGVACCALAFMFLDRTTGHNRNFYVYSTFALPLIVAGCRVLWSGTLLTAAFSALAVLTIATGFRQNRDTLRIHSAVYLIAAIWISGLVPDALHRLVRSADRAAPEVTASYLVALAAAALCYAAIVAWGKTLKWADQAEALVSAALVCLGSLGLMSGLAASVAPLRTGLITALAVGCAWAGMHWSRLELIRLAYPLLALGGYKLLREDLQGKSLMLFLSLLVVGGGLIVLPRLLKARRFA